MKYQWMPMFWGDFFANTLHLSAQEIGAYVLLIAHAWEHNAEISVKDAQRIARVHNRHWAKVREKLAPFFEPQDGLLGITLKVVHTRCATELSIAAEMSNKRRGAAEQMHANRRARAQQVHPHYSTSTSKNSSLGKEGNGADMQVHGSFRDKGVDYRAPPAKKSDNDLSDTNRADLKALAKRRS